MTASSLQGTCTMHMLVWYMCETVCNKEKEPGHDFLLCFSTWPKLTLFQFFFFIFMQYAKDHTNTPLHLHTVILLCSGRLFKKLQPKHHKRKPKWLMGRESHKEQLYFRQRHVIDTWVACGLILYWKTRGQIWRGWFRESSAMWEKNVMITRKSFKQYW